MDFAIVYLDRYHQEDPLFLRSLSWALKSEQAQAPPFVLVHGSGEYTERQLEAEGLMATRSGGTLEVSTTAERTLVERTIREFNQKTVAVLTDQQIPAVGVQGTDRNLFRITEQQTIEVGKLQWIQDLARRRVVPVISALALNHEGVTVEVDPARIITALQKEAGVQCAAAAVFFSKADHAQLKQSGKVWDVVSSQLLTEHPANPEPETLATVLSERVPVYLTNPMGFATGKHTTVDAD